MLSFIFRDGQLMAKGTLNVGLAGNFECKEYGDEDVFFESQYEEFIETLDGDYPWITPLLPMFEDKNPDGETVARVLEEYYKQVEEKVQKNIKQINDYFLYQLISNMINCGYPFWEVEEAVLPEYRDWTEEEFEAVYDDLWDDRLDEDFDGTSNDGSMEKMDVEAFIREKLPMFNLDGLLASIEPEGISIDGAWWSLQFSDGWGCNFFCSAYEKFDENLIPQDWHNF